MDRVRVVGSLGQPGRCAYCHDTLDALGHPCAGCGTWAHIDCWDELRRCPSSGCGASVDLGAPLPPAEEGQRRHASSDAHLLRWAASSEEWVRCRGRRAVWGPYRRLLLSGVSGSLLIALLAGGGLASLAFVMPLLTTRAEAGPSTVLACTLLFASPVLVLLGLALAWSVADWVATYARAWRSVGPLLRDAHPLPARISVQRLETEEGSTTIAQLRAVEGGPPIPVHLQRLHVEGMLSPGWLRQPCDRQPVLVYGADRGIEAILIESTRGQLALVPAREGEAGDENGALSEPGS